MIKTPLVWMTFIAVGLTTLVPAPALANDAGVVTAATRTLEEMAADPSNGVPVSLLRVAEGVVLVPNMINASFVVGVKMGRGVFLVKDSKGRWGNPVHVFVSGGSFGLQAGGQATEMVMVFRSKESVNRLLAGKGKFTLGADAGVAAGPSGKSVGAETDIEFKAEILTYAKSRGLFAGASLSGTAISVDRNKNSLYYDNFASSTFQIVEGDSVSIPPEAARLKASLMKLAAPKSLPRKKGQEDDADESIDPRVSRSSKVIRKTSEDDEPEVSSTGRPSTRRKRPAAADDDLNDEPAPRTASATTRKRPPASLDESADSTDDLPPPVKMKPVRRPAPETNPDDDPLPPPKAKPTSGN